jgi:hypothetical protein
MSIPSKFEIEKSLNDLRKLIESTEDEYIKNIAYAMESAIIWARKSTEEWPQPAKEAVILAKIFRNEVIEQWKSSSPTSS